MKRIHSALTFAATLLSSNVVFAQAEISTDTDAAPLAEDIPGPEEPEQEPSGDAPLGGSDDTAASEDVGSEAALAEESDDEADVELSEDQGDPGATREEEAPGETNDDSDDQADEEPETTGSFEFGSYGRINIASDLQGRVWQDTDIVSFGTRYDLDNYVELEFRREDHIGKIHLKEVMTLALAGEFFHFDAQFQEDLAFRNLFVSATNVLNEGNEIWVGQRMVRGDDIYLVNFWPMDNLNITGGGVIQNWKQVQAALTVGQYRPQEPFYYQTDLYLPRTGFNPVEYAALNRPRTVVAGRLTGMIPFEGGAGSKLVLYSEHHSIPSGTRVDEGDTLTQLPKDDGFVVGAQVGVWKGHRQGFVNLFGRCAFGLAVYDPLFAPFSIGTPTDTAGARDCTAGLSSNIELKSMGIQTGGYIRGFRDQEEQIVDGGGMVEGIFDVRPYIWIGENAGVQVDLSYQSIARAQTDESGRQVGGSIGKFAVMPFISPWGRGTYTRPHLSLVYALTLRDEGAQRLYPEEHPFAQRGTSHYLGLGAEWWFNSTSY